MKQIDHPAFSCWSAMKRRCYNKNHETYRYYGGRGIRVCLRWRRSFWAFARDMGERPSPAHTLERENNDGNYEPGNVVWATKEVQANNRRRRPSVCQGLFLEAVDWTPVSVVIAAGLAQGRTEQAMRTALSVLVGSGALESEGKQRARRVRARGATL